MRYSEQRIAEAQTRGDAAAVAYWQRIKAQVDEAPPFTPIQRAQLSVLLSPAPAAVAPTTRQKRRAVLLQRPGSPEPLAA